MIDISNVINVSVAAPGAGLAPYSINNLACFTKDTPINPITTYAAYVNLSSVATDWGTTSNVYAAAAAVFSQSPNILSGDGQFLVVPMVGNETLTDAITRVKDLLYFGGCSYDFSAGNTEVENAATYCQSIRRMLFVVSATASDLTSGLLYAIQQASNTQTQLLYYSASAGFQAFKWGFAGRGMSTNFAGSNTTQTMHLKQIAGVDPDSGVTQTILNEAKAVGASVYVSIAGRPTTMTYGANGFMDDTFNLNWLVDAIEVAGFNLLGTVSTKIPQTESGMASLKGAYAQVCEQAVSNGFVAPGEWTSGDTFGDPETFKRNIAEKGYYIYSSPIATQSSDDRALRKSPVCQIALKYAGSIHSSNILINVNE